MRHQTRQQTRPHGPVYLVSQPYDPYLKRACERKHVVALRRTPELHRLEYHLLRSYTSAYLSRLPRVPLATGRLAWVGSAQLRCTGAYHYLRGHSIYVSYEKKGIKI
jgi:hypothetical protein